MTIEMAPVLILTLLLFVAVILWTHRCDLGLHPRNEQMEVGRRVDDELVVTWNCKRCRQDYQKRYALYELGE